MNRPIRVTINLSEPVKEAADKAAEQDNRPLSSLIQSVLIKFLQEHGFLKREKSRTGP